MAFMNQERKKELAPAIKAVLKKYNVKASIAVRNYSTLVVNIKSGKIDLIDNYNKNDTRYKADKYIDVNPYWYRDHFTGESLKFLIELFNAMNDGNHDNSDTQTDYFDIGWYTDVNIGQWNKPYQTA